MPPTGAPVSPRTKPLNSSTVNTRGLCGKSRQKYSTPSISIRSRMRSAGWRTSLAPKVLLIIKGACDAPRWRAPREVPCALYFVDKLLHRRFPEPHEGSLSRAVDVVGEIIPIGVVQCVQVYSVCSHRHVHI